METGVDQLVQDGGFTSYFAGDDPALGTDEVSRRRAILSPCYWD